MPRLEEDPPAESLERLAILLDDIEGLDPVMRTKLFGPGLCRLDLDSRVNVEGVGAVLVLKGPLLQSALIVDLALSHSREEGTQAPRFYLDKGQGWKAVSIKQPLTLLLRGSTVLNPAVFDVQLESESLAAEAI